MPNHVYSVVIPKVQELLKPYVGKIANIGDTEKRALKTFLELDASKPVDIEFTRGRITSEEMGLEILLQYWMLSNDPTEEQEDEMCFLRDSLYDTVRDSIFKEPFTENRSASFRITKNEFLFNDTISGYGETFADQTSRIKALKNGLITGSIPESMTAIKRIETVEQEGMLSTVKNTEHWTFTVHAIFNAFL